MKRILFTGLAAITLMAYGCSKENVTSDGNNPNSPNGKLHGYITFNLQGSDLSRTTPDGGTEPGVEDDVNNIHENTVNDITIVFTTSSGVITSVARNIVHTNLTTDPIEISTGTHYVFALVNVESIYTDLNLGINQNINQVIEAADVDVVTSGFRNGSFLMTSERNSSTVSGGVAVTINSTHTETTPATATIKIDRAAVKIEDLTVNASVVLDPALTANGIAEVEVSGFVPLNINPRFNLIQQWSNKNENNAAANPLTSTEVLHTPVYDPSDLIAKPIADQFFYPISRYTTVAVNGSDIESVTDLTVNNPGIVFAKRVYTTENRPTIFITPATFKPTAGRAEATGVVFRVQAKSDASTNKATFYTYNGLYYADLADIQALDDFTGNDLTALAIPQLRALGIKVYENGVMYYTYFILDPNTSHQYSSSNYYGVFRNSIYRLNIKTLKTLGDDVPGGTDVTPSEVNPPIDSDNTYLTVTLSVNPWVLNLIDLEL